MPEVKVLAPAAKSFTGIVKNQEGRDVHLGDFVGRRIKRATRIGPRVVIHLVGAPAGELIVFDSPEDYETVILREFISS